MILAFKYPTGSFTILEPSDEEISKLKVIHTMNFEALKL